MEELLLDPQTSGGLLISAGAQQSEELLNKLKGLDMPCAIVGEVIEKQSREIIVI